MLITPPILLVSTLLWLANPANPEHSVGTRDTGRDHSAFLASPTSKQGDRDPHRESEGEGARGEDRQAAGESASEKQNPDVLGLQELTHDP